LTTTFAGAGAVLAGGNFLLLLQSVLSTPAALFADKDRD